MGRRAVRTTLASAVAGGLAELVPDPDVQSGWTVLVDSVPQSYVDIDEPTRLPFEYMRRIAHVIDLMPDGPLRVVHLGGGAMSLARYVCATRPGSSNLVIEPDARLVDFVRAHLGWPSRWRIRVRCTDAHTGLTSLRTSSADLVILDVFDHGRTPGELTTIEVFAEIARVLRPAGMFTANIADGGALTYARRFSAGLTADLRLDHVIAEPGVLRGRRFANLVVVAGRPGAQQVDVDRLRRACAADPWPARVLDGVDLVRFIGTHVGFRSGDAPGSPEPPAGFLRG